MCTFSCIPKSGDGLFRPIVNLRPLNRCIRYENFKMENLNSVRSLLRKGDFMVNIDLKDAYFLVGVRESLCKFVFSWNARDSQSTSVDGIPPPSRLEIIRKSFRRVIGISREMRSETLRVSSPSLSRSFSSVMLVVVFCIVLFTAVSRFQFRKANNAGGRKNGQS